MVKDLPEGALQGPLDGFDIRLTLKSGEPSTIIGDFKDDFHSDRPSSPRIARLTTLSKTTGNRCRRLVSVVEVSFQ